MDKYTKLLDAAKNLRRVQKEYFRSHSPVILSDAKRLEKEFDKLLVELEHPQDTTILMFCKEEENYYAPR